MKNTILALAATLALFAPARAQEPVILPADQPEAMTFYTPNSFLALIGIHRAAGQPERFSLCNLSAAPIFARVEWTSTDAGPLEHEAFLRPGACSIRTLAPGEQPTGPAGLRTTWQRLGPRMEHRP